MKNGAFQECMNRIKIQERLTKAKTLAEDPTVLYCIEPFAKVAQDGGNGLGRLLARLGRDPDHGSVVATTNAFVFAFGGQVDRGEKRPNRKGSLCTLN